MKKYILEIIVFICGAVVMILELVGSRVLAPYVGTSIIVWTSLIGIILGSLSLGYWWGGKIADKKPSYKTFSFIIFTAAVSIGLVTFLKSIVLNFLQAHITSIHLSATLSTVILFSLPSILLGMVSPYAVRLKIKDLDTSGTTVGTLYAISTIGSIAGTFMAGFVLIAYFGSTNILLVLSLVLVLTSLIAYIKSNLALKAIVILSLILGLIVVNSYDAFLKKQGFIDVDTQYNRVLIYKSIDEETERPILNMLINPREVQSAMFLDNDNDLVLKYSKFFHLVSHFKPDLRRSLMIGGAGYSFPKDYLKKYTEASIDVVEIDPILTQLAKRYFNLRDNQRLTIYHEDGRTFVNKTKNTYDVIFTDAMNSLYSIPFQLTTVETVHKMYDMLTDDGVVMVNMISSIEGKEGAFLRAEYATFKTVFTQVYLFPVEDAHNSLEVQNIILVALKSKQKPPLTSKDRELNGYLKNLWTKEIKMDMPILTDDYAPVDNYIVKIIKRF